MHETVAFVGPAWLWLVAVVALVAFVGSCGWLLCWALGLRHTLDRLAEYEENGAMKVDVERELHALHRRIDEHTEEEHCGPLSTRKPRAVRT
jgi:outer membrane lipopolysaccharide assembly protein LptE/RlpB